MARKDRQFIREAVLEAAEELMSKKGFNGVSMRDIASRADVNLGSVTYHFGTKEKLLEFIYQRHTRPMNQRRIELLNEAERISNVDEKLSAIVRAYVLPAMHASGERGGGARFTRLRAILSMEGHETAGRIIAEAFDETTHAFVDAIARVLPSADRSAIVWRCHFLLGALYYTLVNSDRVGRLSQQRADGEDRERAVDELVASTTASLKQLSTGALQAESGPLGTAVA